MTGWKRFRPSTAMIVATIALILAASGVGVGASLITGGQIKKGSVTGSQIKNGSITGPDIKNHSITKAKLKGNFQGPRGTTGATGAQGLQGLQGKGGPAGEATAYARVAADGTLEPGDGGKQNKNVVVGNIEHDATTGPGVYCFGGLTFAVASAMVSPDSAGDIITNEIASVAIQRGITLGSCDAAHQQARVSMVTVSNAVAPALTDHRFQIWFEATGGVQIAPGPGGD
jgi:hypothetical protein